MDSVLSVRDGFDILSSGFIEQPCHYLMPVRGHEQRDITGNGSAPEALIRELGGFIAF